jgi:uncharacterized protein (DUF924 family)
MTPQDVLSFWFVEHGPGDWFKKDPAFDTLIRDRFGATLAAGLAGELHRWRETADGRLAEIIVLDQFSRNIHRDTPASFAADPLALCLAQWAVASGADQEIDASQRPFVYMPFMHSESAAIHNVALELFAPFPQNHEYERKHQAIIVRFGRYPHRNKILGRASTAEELAFLQRPGSSF